ncbi:sigma-70 family RNA polymerase sigma factor [Halobacillus sp. Marseille-Q1614]|uniref:sigma-70 family RNA polymerase sigma factor n=1 Tax=Halobacillus sp. Marseille-Q1614 TaxID=2709134 RepID=UPI001570E34B|nr:sigma-70 family RNA polymerase sigma factor [Halobacillus sp. Marseille-Q1614]
MSRVGVKEVIKDSLFANVLSMEEKAKDKEHKEGIGYSIPDREAESPYEHVVKKENINELADHIKRLNEKEQLVVGLFYNEELTLTEIGGVLELTTSRISQIHSNAIFKLRKSLLEVIGGPVSGFNK